MARQLRIEYEGAFYHVTARGNERRDIYKDDQDRNKFLEYLCKPGISDLALKSTLIV